MRAEQQWDPGRYLEAASFVPALGTPLVDLLSPQPGERVLDLGCGEGTLTATIAARGASVVGVDSSAEMVRAARERGLDARVADGAALPADLDGGFDAVFSNAALHWMSADPAGVARGVQRVLRPGGRFVAELGGHGNVAAVRTALRAVLTAGGLPVAEPWYFPTPEDYAQVLTGAGLEVVEIGLFGRPTPLPGAMSGWLATFGEPYLGRLEPAVREQVVDAVEQLLAPALRDGHGRWTCDYVRLRVHAVRPAERPQ